MVHFPGFLDRLGITEARIGFLYGCGAVLALSMRPAFGKILDLTHRRTVLLVTGLLNGLLVLSLVFAGTWGPMLWALFLGHRVLQIVLFTAMLTYAADAIPVARRTQGLAIFGLSGLVPIAIGGALGEVLIGVFGFAGLFVASALASVTSWSLVWRFPKLPIIGRRARRGFWAALAQRDLLPLWWVTLCFSVGLETLFTFTRTFVESRGVGSAGLFFGVYGTMAAVTRLAAGGSYDRVPKRAAVTISIFVYGSCLFILAGARVTWMLVVAAAIGGTAHGAVFPILSSQVVSRARTAERGSAMAIFTSIFDIALLLSAPAVGSLIEGSGYGVSLAAVGSALWAGAVVYTVWDRGTSINA